MNRDLNWHLVYTKAGMEKRVALQLEQKGLQTFFPIHTTSLLMGKQVTTFPKPLFSSWVFVCCCENELLDLRQVKGIVNVVYRLSKPVVVSEAEIATIHFVLSNFSRVSLIHTGLQPTEKLLPLPENKLAYPLPSLGYCLLADERTIVNSLDPSVRIPPDDSTSRMAHVKESFAYLLSQFSFLTAPKR